MHSFITLTVATLTALTAAVPHAGNQFSFHHIREVAPIVKKDTLLAGRAVPGTVNLSPIGQCGGTTGYQCAEGFCCSKWGYCGTTEDYCGVGGGSDNTTSGTGPTRPHRPHHGRPHRPPPSYSSPPIISVPAGSAAPVPSASAAPVPSGAPSAAPSAAPSGAPSAVPSSPASAPPYSAPPAPSPSAPSTGGGNWQYKMFNGDGSAGAGWPSQDSWVDFETAFQNSVVNMKASCAQWNQENDSDQEISDIKSAIQSVASSSGVDSRFVLAIMMQESNGCVRVQTTDNGVRNPGLMQSHDGSGTCWNDGTGTNPCPASEITDMISNGVEGTPSGDGLKQCLSQCPSSGSQSYYQAAVIYNSGNLPSNLDDNTATPCYASDVANRLMGWWSGTSSCTL